ncbi:MAG TPA: nucleoside hydrolase [Acidimicrobiales bacterium]|nr:nucleoside hydrolase [Acidimicrobiales bacterium]
MRVHLDTDFAGDTDDAAALALLLGSEDVEVTGITTVADPDGRRAGYVHRVLALTGREEIPVAAGAGVSSTTGRPMGDLPDHFRYWGDGAVQPRPSADGEAVSLLTASVDTGAVVIGIGPYTNLARLEAVSPGSLARTQVVLMGGWVHPPAPDLPQWGPDMDWNVQCDTAAARTVFEAAAGDGLVLVTLTATLGAHLRAGQLGRLEASGPLGRLLARQARAHAEDHQMAGLGRSYPGLPDDLLNFQYDPVAAAVAVGLPVATAAVLSLQTAMDGGVLRFVEAGSGRSCRVVTDVDGSRFDEVWLTSIERADRRLGP